MIQLPPAFVDAERRKLRGKNSAPAAAVPFHVHQYVHRYPSSLSVADRISEKLSYKLYFYLCCPLSNRQKSKGSFIGHLLLYAGSTITKEVFLWAAFTKRHNGSRQRDYTRKFWIDSRGLPADTLDWREALKNAIDDIIRSEEQPSADTQSDAKREPWDFSREKAQTVFVCGDGIVIRPITPEDEEVYRSIRIQDGICQGVFLRNITQKHPKNLFRNFY